MENNSNQPIPQQSQPEPQKLNAPTPPPAVYVTTSPTNPTWLLILIFVVILGGTGFSVFNYFKTTPIQADPKMQRVAASTITQPDPVWNTFRSNVNTFTFTYPNTLYPHTNSYNNVDEIVFKPLGKVESTALDAKGGFNMKLYAPDEMIPDIVNLNDFADGVKAKFAFDYKNETLTINGLTVKKLSGYSKTEKGEKGRYISDIFIKTNDGAMYTQFITGENPTLTSEVITQIIQSIKSEKIQPIIQ